MLKSKEINNKNDLIKERSYYIQDNDYKYFKKTSIIFFFIRKIFFKKNKRKIFDILNDLKKVKKRD